MRQLILTLAIIVFTTPFVHAEPELKGSPSVLANYLSSIPKEVTLNGEAKIEIQAKSGVVTIGIKTEAPHLQRSLQKSQQLRNEITTKLISSGISQNRIKGTKFSSTPEYGFFGKKPNNYVVENLLKITVTNEIELQEVAGIVDSYKDVYYQGIELKEQKKEEIKIQLLDKALANAKTRQNIYEKELDISLKPISFEEFISVETPEIKQRHVRKGKMLYSSLASDSGSSNNLSLGEHVYHGRVQVKYNVTDRKK